MDINRITPVSAGQTKMAGLKDQAVQPRNQGGKT